MKKLSEIIPYGTISLNTDILHGLSELKNCQYNNKNILASKLDIFFEIMNKTKQFIDSPRFKLSFYNRMKCLKFLNSILNLLNEFFGNEANYKIFIIPLSLLFQKIFEILNFVLKGNNLIESKNLEAVPLRLTEIENGIFAFIENIPLINEQYIYDFIKYYISYDLKDLHTGALSKRGIESLLNIIKKSKDNCFILKEKGKYLLFQLFDKLNSLFQTMNNENIIQVFIEKNKEIIYPDIINLICELFFAIINKLEEKNNDKALMKIIQFCEIIFEQCIKELKLIKDKKYLKELKDIYNKIIKSIIHFLFLEMLPFIFVILKENEIKNLENKFLKMLVIDFNNNNKEQDNINNIINETINQTFIDSLFIICKYQSNEEILNYINKFKVKDNIKEKYISNFITFKKRCTSLLITKLTEILSEYKELYEKGKEDALAQKIISLLSEIKNLEVFPGLVNTDNNKKAKNEKNDEQYNNKKIHIFYLYNIIVDYILINNKDIQLLIKDLLLIAFKGIELPPLQKFEEK